MRSITQHQSAYQSEYLLTFKVSHKPLTLDRIAIPTRHLIQSKWALHDCTGGYEIVRCLRLPHTKALWGRTPPLLQHRSKETYLIVLFIVWVESNCLNNRYQNCNVNLTVLYDRLLLLTTLRWGASDASPNWLVCRHIITSYDSFPISPGFALDACLFTPQTGLCPIRCGRCYPK